LIIAQTDPEIVALETLHPQLARVEDRIKSLTPLNAFKRLQVLPTHGSSGRQDHHHDVRTTDYGCPKADRHDLTKLDDHTDPTAHALPIWSPTRMTDERRRRRLPRGY
jgi:hypothetical protein